MNYLKHHGILGQKWGVRRFQNKDGSLTKAGESRYGHDLQDKPSRSDTNVNQKDSSSSSSSELTYETANRGRIVATAALTTLGAFALGAAARYAFSKFKDKMGLDGVDFDLGDVDVEMVGIDLSSTVPPIVIDDITKAIIPV